MNTIGYAGSGPHLQARMASPLQSEGLYRAKAGPVVFQALAEVLPEGLTAGLLLARPSIEGHAYLETDGGAYQRQPVAFEPISSRLWSSIAEVRFPMPGAAKSAASHLGIFGVDGALLYYGWLAIVGPMSSGHPGVRFAAGEIQISRPARRPMRR